MLLTGLGVIGAVWAFIALADEVKEGDTSHFDRMILLAFRVRGHPIGPRWLEETQRDLTALGGFTTLTFIVIFAVALLLVHGRRLQALIFAIAVVLAQVLSEVVKHFVDRPRPDIVPYFDQVYSSSFPSGHATMAPVVYLTLAAILCASDHRTAGKVLIVLGAALLVAAVGVSRVYLGVHWPTDVLAGWTLGCAIALAASYALHRIGGNGTSVEPPPMARSVS